jgi:asparagine synthase (glutamine-hydrolysing)
LSLIGFGHRRLAIVDLSSAGHQPMVSSSGRHVLACNGEIYNHEELRRQLAAEGHRVAWRGHSDMETLLECIDAWGVNLAIARTVGMFAFGVWNQETKTLTLGRDRFGEKPLYCGWQGDVFFFGSELKALRAHPSFRPIIDRRALPWLMRKGCIPEPLSIYKGIQKVTPGTLLTVSLARPVPAIHVYWSTAGEVVRAQQQPYHGTPEQAVDDLDRLLGEAVRAQRMADVPLGVFLSGGVDSATIASLLQEQSSNPIETFSIGFADSRYNEAENAKAIARHLGTAHRELYISSTDALAVCTELPELYCEPFSDPSQIPTILLSRFARGSVSVALTGDAGDELFCGYPRYLEASRLWRWLSVPNRALRSRASRGLTRTLSLVDHAGRSATSSGSYRARKAAAALASESPEALYEQLVSHYFDVSLLLSDVAEQPRVPKPDLAAIDDPIRRIMTADLLGYLPDDILVKVDRAAMSNSLETRVPFLDPRVVEFTFRLPQSMLVRDGVSKWLLREVLHRRVPRELLAAGKRGFNVPLDTWLRGPLREWADHLLGEARLRDQGFFNSKAIRHLWLSHLKGERNWAPVLWNTLMFQAWLECNA